MKLKESNMQMASGRKMLKLWKPCLLIILVTSSNPSRSDILDFVEPVKSKILEETNSLFLKLFNEAEVRGALKDLNPSKAFFGM